MKKIIVLVLALALAAVALPAAASANWTHKGVEIKSGDPDHLTLEGTAKFEDPELGGVHCTKEAYATITLTKESNHGHVLDFGDTNPTVDCHVEGLLGSICGEHSLMEVYLEGQPTLTATPEVGNGRTIDVNNITLVNVFGSTPEPCLVLHLTGSVTATVDNQSAFSSATLSGSLESSLGTTVNVSGSLAADVPGTFGNNGKGE